MIKISKFKILFLLSTCYFLFAAPGAQAARLYFVPQELAIGTEKEFQIVVNIDAPNRINAVFAALKIPKSLTPSDINEANSVINFFVDKPHFDEASRLLTFSGIIPGGFEDKGAPLLILKFKAEAKEEKAFLSFDKEKTKVYLHTPDGILDSLILETLNLPIVKGKENISFILPDNEPPESFVPEITKDQNIFNEKWFLVFATQDKGSGMHHYEILETRSKEQETNKEGWIEAESPYPLKDQNLKSFIYIRAIDKAGNERVVTIPPQKPVAWYENYENWIIIVLGALIAAFMAKKLWKKRKFRI